MNAQLTQLKLDETTSPIALVEYAPRGFTNEIYYYLVAPGQLEIAKATVSEWKDQAGAYVKLTELNKEAHQERRIAGQLLLQWFDIPAHYWAEVAQGNEYQWEWHPSVD
jgi:hypothetical protein